jgi:hypothetical protein
MLVVASEMSVFEPVIAFTTLLARAALCVQDQAVMEINLGAQRLSAELAMADAAEGDKLRKTLASVSAEKEALEQQLEIMSTLDELKDSAGVTVQAVAVASSSRQDEVTQQMLFTCPNGFIRKLEPCMWSYILPMDIALSYFTEQTVHEAKSRACKRFSTAPEILMSLPTTSRPVREARSSAAITDSTSAICVMPLST